MYLVTTRLEAGCASRSAQVDEPLLASLLREAAGPDDGLEHVYVACDPRGADLVLFLLQPRLGQAEAVAGRLSRRCLGRARQLSGWSLGHYGTDLVPTLSERALLPGPPAVL
ncbi:hypothetical protein [Streptomyces sp. NPDC089915]|uniref:hypothetical protein n=1 Tax=Streptomyces sp. NPDC089915 TaxID=3155186 RepID=UPI00341402D4